MKITDEEFVCKWEKTRINGKWRFIIIRGILFFGMSMFIFMYFIFPEQLNWSLEKAFISFAKWVAYGAIFGWWMWQYFEKKYLSLTINSDISQTFKLNEINNSFCYGPITDRIIAATCLVFSAFCIWNLFFANVQNPILELLNITMAFFFGWMGLIFISEKCRAFGFGLIQAIGFIILIVGAIYLFSIIPVSVAIILGSVIIGFFIYIGLKKKHDAD